MDLFLWWISIIVISSRKIVVVVNVADLASRYLMVDRINERLQDKRLTRIRVWAIWVIATAVAVQPSGKVNVFLFFDLLDISAILSEVHVPRTSNRARARTRVLKWRVHSKHLLWLERSLVLKRLQLLWHLMRWHHLLRKTLSLVHGVILGLVLFLVREEPSGDLDQVVVQSKAIRNWLRGWP